MGPAGANGVSGWVRVPGTASASNETSPKTVTADCPAGTSVVGGGFVVLAAPGLGVNVAEITVSASYPSDGDTWSVTAAEDNDGDVGNWSAQAYAICASV